MPALRQTLALALALFARTAFSQSADDLEFFEKKVRPLLSERCYECHSAEKKTKGGLRLDTRDGWARGGDSGPALVPGEVEKSLLSKAIRWTDLDLQMPPKQKLSDAEIQTLEEWVRRGAPDPRNANAPKVAQRETKKHWAYEPVARVEGSIDRFVTSSERASDAQLLRRITFDLTGLPPSEADFQSFTSIARKADELLASRRFAEHWARHWLDIVRFAESVTLRGFIFKEAWRYRDYVIDSFHNDRPLDRFLREQVSGDLLPERQIVATTFLMLGNTNLEEQDKKQLEMDVVDEQLDVIGKAFLGQTISCARCHDHKFDPIPAKDYYALAGILRGVDALKHANVSEWLEQPLPLDAAEEARFQAAEEEIAALEAELKKLKGASAPKVDVIDPKSLPGIVVDSARAAKVGEWKHSRHNKPYIGDGYFHDDNSGKGTKTISFQPELTRAGKYDVRLAYAYGDSRAANVPVTIFHADGETTIHLNQKERPADGSFASLGQFRFEGNGFGHVLVSNDGTAGHVTADAVQFLPVENFGGELATAAVDTKPLEDRLRKLKDTAPRRPMAMAPRENGNGRDLAIHIRGSVHQLGAIAPRGFLSAFDVPAPEPRGESSGRIELANWLTHPKNPLTARVYVNRVWLWLTGEGIVRTPDNFGATGEPPTNPQLLDYLAQRFMDHGWSTKKLIREIVLSRAYASANAPRRRLTAEAIRDSMLAVSGELDLTRAGGKTFPEKVSADYNYTHTDLTRSIYVPVFRNALPTIFEAFNFPSPSMVVGKRDNSIVATQALFLMNDPWVRERAEAAARRLKNDPNAIERAFARTLGRKPTQREKEITGAAPLADVFQALFASPEFRWID